MEERGLEGLEARSGDGAVIGRIVEVLADEETGEVTHVLVENEGGEELELPIAQLSLDPEADFARFHADPSDEEPGDHLGDEERPLGYAEAQPHDEEAREAGEAGGWEDEGTNTADSGYPRNDAYINPDTGEEEVDPLLEDNESLEAEVRNLLSGTELSVRSAKEGVVELSGSAATRDDLDASVEEILGLEDVLDVDTTDVQVG
jgi:hypothetical protein